ncbi:MAG: 3'-5' exonuclease [Acidobacteriota bacterium]
MAKNELNREQRDVIECLRGPVLVLAPVGTGKTLVLAERVKHAIATGVVPERTLCLTFTNRAAGEIAARVRSQSPEAAPRLLVKTFHGLCARMLRMEARAIGMSRDFVIFDDMDSMELLHDLFSLDMKEAKSLYYEIERIKSDTLEDMGNYGETSRKVNRYQAELRKMSALDYADLIRSVRVMLSTSEEIKNRWRNRFDLIQVDEVQDTHNSEYEVLRTLAEQSRNIALIGDLDQTIYEWRGSEPDEILARYRKEFNPREFSLIKNYRATKTLLHAASSFANILEDRRTSIVPAASCGIGQPIGIRREPNEAQEASWIAQKIRAIASSDYSRIAVLVRKNDRAALISDVLEHHGVPCFTVEQYEFFRRQEIKDALAYLKLLMNPEDRNSLGRVLLRPPCGIGDATIARIIFEGATCGLRLNDMVSASFDEDGEPYGRLIRDFRGGTISVVDVETTGLETGRDEVVEIAAVRIDRGRPAETFHQYIANTVPVADSEAIHGWSDAFLKQNGLPAAEVYREFNRFIEGGLVVGHNIRFDLRMMAAHARRAGQTMPNIRSFDTWAIALRLLPGLEDYKLGTVAGHLRITGKPEHKAEADVMATEQILERMMPVIEEGSARRQTIVARHKKAFDPLKANIASLSAKMDFMSPAELLENTLEQSGLREYYRCNGESRRLEHLERLKRIFKEKGELGSASRLAPRDALASILEYAALARNVDHICDQDNLVAVITIHQAKGLEFDIVFIAGASEDEIPSYLSVQGGRAEEEKRLFYVAMTRAKRQLFISSYEQSVKGRIKEPSRFLSALPERLIEQL